VAYRKFIAHGINDLLFAVGIKVGGLKSISANYFSVTCPMSLFDMV